MALEEKTFRSEFFADYIAQSVRIGMDENGDVSLKIAFICGVSL